MAPLIAMDFRAGEMETESEAASAVKMVRQMSTMDNRYVAKTITHGTIAANDGLWVSAVSMVDLEGMDRRVKRGQERQEADLVHPVRSRIRLLATSKSRSTAQDPTTDRLQDRLQGAALSCTPNETMIVEALVIVSVLRCLDIGRAPLRMLKSTSMNSRNAIAIAIDTTTFGTLDQTSPQPSDLPALSANERLASVAQAFQQLR